MKIANINLLPWKEALLKEKQKEYYVYSGIFMGIGALIVFSVFTFNGMMLDDKKSSNDFLKLELKKLETQIEEIKTLKEQTQSLLSRKQIIENLQSDRSETVSIFSELGNETPDGVLLKSLKQEGKKITLNGASQSNNKISSFMKSLDASPTFEKPKLLESKAGVLQGRRVYDFSMTVETTRTIIEEVKVTKETKKGVKK